MSIFKNIFSILSSNSFFDTFKNSSYYFISFIIVQFLSFVSVPIFTKYLSPSDFGSVEIFLNYSRLLGVIFSLNISSGLVRYVYEKDIVKEDLISFCLTFSTTTFLVFLFFFLIFQNSFLELLNIQSFLFLPLLIYTYFLNIICPMFLVELQITSRNKLVALWTVLTHIIRLSIVIFIIVFVSNNIKYRIFSEVTISILIVIVSYLLYMRKYIKFNLKYKDKTLEIIKYSISFMPLNLSSFLLVYIDGFMINSILGSKDAGLYSFAYKICIIYSGVSSSFAVVIRNKLFNYKNSNDINLLHNEQNSFLKFSTFIFIFFLFFSKDLGILLASNNSFHEGLIILPIILLSILFNDFTDAYNFYINYEKKNSIFIYTFFFTTILNIILNFIYIPIYGYISSACITLISYIVLFILIYFSTRYFIKTDLFPIKFIYKYIYYAILMIIMYYIIYYFFTNELISLISRFIILIAFSLFYWRNLYIKRIFK